jgi:hypothetical protein
MSHADKGRRSLANTAFSAAAARKRDGSKQGHPRLVDWLGRPMGYSFNCLRGPFTSPADAKMIVFVHVSVDLGTFSGAIHFYYLFFFSSQFINIVSNITYWQYGFTQTNI